MTELERLENRSEVATFDGEVEVLEPDAPAGERTDLVLARASVPPPDRHPALVYLASLSAGESRRTMRQALDRIAAFASDGHAGVLNFAWHELRYQHTALIRSALSHRYAPSSANTMLSALRGVLKECFRLGYTRSEDYQRARDIKNVRGSSLPKGRALSQGELIRLFAACNEDESKVRGARDAALIAVLYGCGLRRSEVVGLDLADYDKKTKELRVRGKGNKERLVYAEGGAAEALEAWVRKRTQREPKSALFHPIIKSGRIIRRRMTDQAVLYILRKRAEEIAARSFSPHDMRRTFISDLLDAGADLATVQKLAGHANVETTARYDRRGERAKKRAASLLHVPYDGGNR